MIVSDAETKHLIINSIYFNESGYGSVLNTFKTAKNINTNITIHNAKAWLNDNIEKSNQPPRTNSFVAPHPFFEFQVDIFSIGHLSNQEFRIGIIYIDMFSKYLAVVPICSKSEIDVGEGLSECLKIMGKHPTLIYSDDEKALQSKIIHNFLADSNIKHHVSRTHAHFAERAIRTFKSMLNTRIANKPNVQWTDYINQLINHYNNNIHSTTGTTPNDARKPSSTVDVHANIELKATHNRNYPILNIGDTVNRLRKKAINEKEHTNKFSDINYKVTEITKQLSQYYYQVEGTEREYLRVELLNI